MENRKSKIVMASFFGVMGFLLLLGVEKGFAQESDFSTNVVSRVENPTLIESTPQPVEEKKEEVAPVSESVTAPEVSISQEEGTPAQTPATQDAMTPVLKPEINESAPAPEQPAVAIQKEKPPESVPQVGLTSVPIPEGKEYWIGARFFEKKSGGWGWVKKPEESWRKARWVAIKEEPRKFHAPGRALKGEGADHQFHYKLLGFFADYTIYDPHRDEVMDVFVIQGYESLGLQKSIDRKPGPPGRFASKKSGAFTRRNMLSGEDDSF